MNKIDKTFKWMTRTWFSTPGWFVNKMTKEPLLKDQLILLDKTNYSSEDIMRIKQFFLNLTFIFFLFYIFITGLLIKGLLLNLILDALICKVPETYFSRIIRFRRKKISKQLPDFIDALTMAIESGMNFSQAFQYVSLKTKNELGEETQKTYNEIDFNISEEEAIQNLAIRIQVDEFTKFVSAIKQAKQLGVSIAETLKIQSKLIRTRKKQKAEELSRTASVKISIPLVFCIFPALLIIYLMPGILRLITS